MTINIFFSSKFFVYYSSSYYYLLIKVLRGYDVEKRETRLDPKEFDGRMWNIFEWPYFYASSFFPLFLFQHFFNTSLFFSFLTIFSRELFKSLCTCTCTSRGSLRIYNLSPNCSSNFFFSFPAPLELYFPFIHIIFNMYTFFWKWNISFF